MLIFTSWLKDIEMCVSEQKLTNIEAVQLMVDYTTEDARGAIEFYLDTNSMWDCTELIEHLKNLFESGKTFSSLVRDFYSQIQCPWEILGQKVISVRLSCKNEVNEVLKPQFASQLCDPYLAAMPCNFLKTQSNKMNFTQL